MPARPALPLVAEIDSLPDATIGGKAASLRRLAAAGLATPPAFVVTDSLFRALCGDAAPEVCGEALATRPFPPGFEAALAARLGALPGDRFVARSSFALEDRAGEVAAGVYESRVDLTAGELAPAVREVLQSGVAPGALAYARARGQPPTGGPFAVLIHPFVRGDARGGAAGADGDVLVDAHEGTPAAGAHTAIVAAVRALSDRHGPVEIEWVARGNEVTFLQLRPFTPPPPPTAWPGWRELEPDERREDWTWDAAHNPLPLSAAQAGLVALVDERCRIGVRQRVIGGYLFTAPDPRGLAFAPEPVAAAWQQILTAAEADLARLATPPELPAALDVFVRHYEPLLGRLPAAARAARKALRAFLDHHLPGEAARAEIALLTDVDSKARERRTLAATPGARAAYLARFGNEAPAWDVATPTYAERPDALPPPPPRAPAPPAPEPLAGLAAPLLAELATLVTQARAAVASGEDDDWLYARLQAPVRRALLALGQRLAASGALSHPDVIFDLPMQMSLALAQGRTIDPAALAAAAGEGRARRQHALAHPPPLGVPPAGRTLRGAGCGGRAVGRVVLRHGPRGHAPPADAILVATSLLPTELPLLHVAALVTATGGPLGHVATQARERGLPAVVGATGADRALADGDLVVVDGVAGVVVKA